MSIKKRFLIAVDESWIADTEQGTIIALDLWGAYIKPLAEFAERVKNLDPDKISASNVEVTFWNVYEDAIKTLKKCGLIQ